ncbi:MAG TPA: hypothetical protein QKA14_02275 [Candidatus Megaira endosymbiont of Hartmannula sinica]|nr:hypothetical protein [Candidatus Megaera endosymbiont of Hartmannula sinica]
MFGIYISYINLSVQEYYAGYILEKFMSIDNLFVISAIFTIFNIQTRHRSRILLWGIMGVIVMRFILISFGIYLKNISILFHYIFAIILIFTGINMLFITKNKTSIKESKIYKIISKNFNITSQDTDKFFLYKKNKLYFSNLFVALILIEITDLLFALDSIPAILLITNNNFIIYSSNIFAILGLRAMYFCLAAFIEKLKYLKYALAILLIFIGLKAIISHYIHIDISFIIFFIITIIGIAIFLSLRENKIRHNRR